MTLASAALDLARQGIPVFAAHCNFETGKKWPCTEHGHLDATTDQAIIKRQFADPLANIIGVPTGAASGIAVLDEDPDHGSEAYMAEHRQKLNEAGPRIQRTRRVSGFHRLYRWSPGLGCTDKLAKGIDIKGEGGWVVWWAANGYEVARDVPLHDLPEMPAWLLEQIEKARGASHTSAAPPQNTEELAPPSCAALLTLLNDMPNPAEATRDDYLSVMMSVQGCIRSGKLDADCIERAKDLAAVWASNWQHPNASDYETERAKWDSDWSKRDRDLSGWEQLLGVARKLGVDTTEFDQAAAAADFDGLAPKENSYKPEPKPKDASEVFDPWERATPPGFPLECLPETLQAVVTDDQRATGADVSAVAMAHLAAVAACVDGRTYLRVKRFGNWTENPRLWVMLVGDPSAKKTPAINAAIAPLKAADRAAMERFRFVHDVWEKEPKGERGREPTPERYVINDATPEKTAEILATNPRGALLHLDELSGWIGSMEKYTSGRGGSANRAFWLQAYQGGFYVQDRIGRGTIPVENLSVNILGGIQPDRLRSMSDLTDDGLLQRFLPVLMGKAGADTDQEPDSRHVEWSEHLNKLIATPPRGLFLDAAGHDIREVDFAEFRRWEAMDALGRGFTSWAGKCTAFMMRLAMALWFADPASLGAVDGLLPARAVEAAGLLMHQFVYRHARTFYQELAGGAGEDTRNIAEWLLLCGKQEVTARDLMRGPNCLREQPVKAIHEKLDLLISGGWLTPESRYDNCRKWLLTPGIRERFEQKAIEGTRRRAMLQESIAEQLERRAQNHARKATTATMLNSL